MCVGSAKKSGDVTELQIGVKVRLTRIMIRFLTVNYFLDKVNISVEDWV